MEAGQTGSQHVDLKGASLVSLQLPLSALCGATVRAINQ